LKLSDCINIIRDSPQNVKLKVVKKPKEAPKTAVEESLKQQSKPTRPAEAPRAEVVVHKREFSFTSISKCFFWLYFE